jgi:uncharacterized protein (DUF885 family)
MNMKRIILSTLFALVGIVAMQAFEMKADTVRIYIVDGKVVKHFDGSALAGKTIKDYNVKVVKNKKTKKYDEVHTITTKKINRITEPVVLDTVFWKNDLKADSIRQGFKYLKEKSAAMKEAAKEMKKNAEEIRVMMKDYIPKVVYVVGDKVVSESDIRKVNPHAIKSITIYKAGSKEAKEYTGDDKSSVVMVKTKK